MAFRRRFSGFRRRSSAASKKQIPRWTAQTVEINTTAASPAAAFTLWTPGTTIGAGFYEEEAKLVRVVGQFSVVPTVGTVAFRGSVGLGIVKTQIDQVPVVGSFYDPLVAAQLSQQDWLRVMNTDVPPNSGANGWLQRHEVDIRVQRRFKSDEALKVMIVNAVAGDITISIDIRILIVIRM